MKNNILKAASKNLRSAHRRFHYMPKRSIKSSKNTIGYKYAAQFKREKLNISALKHGDSESGKHKKKETVSS